MRKCWLRVLFWFCVEAEVLAGLALTAGCDGGGGGGAGSEFDFGDNDPAKVVALGDSITQGSEGIVPYPVLLPSMIGKSVVDAGKGGDTASQGLSHTAGLLRQHKPGYLIILFGTNDAIDGRPTSDTIAALRSIVSVARDNNTFPVLVTPPPMVRTYAIYNGGVAALVPAIQGLGSELGVPVANVYGAFGSHDDLLQENGLHPTQAGQEVITSVIGDLF